ncbi:alcohol dehydrogenase catalytic domain-containing protein [Micromonospora sp. NPDC049662]|uniref:alcohol dehydrogenase catalytic domain-containing protein n=1 Tax=Micromonospora sp. NPDC049662 TaxID=3155397 RepID=UPI0034306DB6
MLVKVRAAAVQPGEVMIRRARHGRWLARFRSRQGSDLAGVVAEAGPQVRGIAVGDEVLGFTHTRASHAEFVVVDDMNLTLRPEGLSPTIPASPADPDSTRPGHAPAQQEDHHRLPPGALHTNNRKIRAGQPARIIIYLEHPRLAWVFMCLTYQLTPCFKDASPLSGALRSL